MTHFPRSCAVALAAVVAGPLAFAEGMPSSPSPSGLPPHESGATLPSTGATGAAGAPSQDTATTSATPPAGSRDETPIVIVVPAWFATDPNLANGCWARLYDKTDFRGTLFPLVGPVNIPSNRAGFITGFELGRNYDSLMVGSRATLTVWDKDDYQNRSTTFGPGQAIPDLDRRMGGMEEIRSMRLTCQP